MTKKYDILIVGAGASGLFLGANLQDKNICIIEKNEKIAKKILVSGGGRCNITNEKILAKYYLGDINFINQTLLSYKEILAFFKKYNLEFIKIKQNQFFCKSSSQDVVNALQKANKNTQIYLNEEVLDLEKLENTFLVKTNKNIFYANKVVIASGGVSFQHLGVSKIGYEIAEKFSIKVQKLSPALVGFTAQKDEFWFKELSGISCKVLIKLNDMSFYDDLLFTHRGISGPAILKASLFWEKGLLSIDFLPNFDFKQIIKSNKNISSVLNLPKRFVKAYLEKHSLEDKAFNIYNQESKEKIMFLKNYIFAPAGNFGFSKAEVTKGGISTDEITENYEAKKVKNLFFIGEILDITGSLGGYNLHFAFSSAKKLANFLKTQLNFIDK